MKKKGIRVMMWIAIIFLGGYVAATAYVRLAPTDVAAMHVVGAPREVGDELGEKSFVVVRAIATTPETAVRALDDIAMATARTKRFAGSVAEGFVTYETRTALMGYPDYTTVSVITAGEAPGGNAAPLLMVHARARYGKLDLGVNQSRVESWLMQLGPNITAP